MIEQRVLYRALRYALLIGLGTVASYLNVRIPGTPLVIDGRWVFGLLGFALTRRWWHAFVVAFVLSFPVTSAVPFHVGLIGNLMYAIPTLVVVRLVCRTLLHPLKSDVVYGLGWFALVVFVYEAFATPATYGFIAFLSGGSFVDGMATGWTTQPYAAEMLLVGLFTGLGAASIRMYVALRERTDELATTLYSIGDAVIATDRLGHVRRVNPVAEALTGWKEAEAVGHPLDEVFRIVAEDTHRPILDPLREVLDRGVVIGLGNHTVLVGKDGNERPIVDSAAPIRGIDGSVEGVVLVFRDQTEERANKRALEQSHRQLETSLRSRDSVLRELHHRTGNSLQLVRSILGLYSDADGIQPVRPLVRAVDRGVYAIALVHEKLKAEMGLSSVSAAELLPEVLRYACLETQGQQGVEIEVRVDDFPISFDSAVPCGLIVSELVVTALSLVPAQGESVTAVALHAERNGATREIVITFHANAPALASTPARWNRDGTEGLRLASALVEDQLAGSVVFTTNGRLNAEVRFIDDASARV